MRVLGFSKKWEKLQNLEFTTFRFPRKDKDWYIGEYVQIVYHPRSKDREFLFNAQIISKESRKLEDINNVEACLDGFKDAEDMNNWIIKTYGNNDGICFPMNKLTLKRLWERN
jgi:hypothetical protein